MNWLYESPFTIILLGAAVSLLLGVIWASTGRREWICGLLVWLVVVGGMLVTERIVITDREQIPLTLQQIINDVKSNDRKKVFTHIYSGASQLKQKAEAELPSYQFKTLRLTKIHSLVIDAKQKPKQAIIEFNILASGNFSAPGIGELSFTEEQPIPRFIRLTFRQETNGTWQVEDYFHSDATAFMFEKKTGE